MIKVLFMHKGGELIRGSEISLLLLLENLDRTQIDPVVLCNRKSFADRVHELGIRFITMDWPEITIDSKVAIQPRKYVKSLLLANNIIKKERIDLLYSNGGLPCQIAVVLAKIKGLKTICHIRSPHSRRYAWMWLFKFSDNIIFVSESVQRSMSSKVRFNNTCVIYNAVDPKIFNISNKTKTYLRNCLSIKDTDIVIGQVGSLIPRKGLDVLFKAFAGLDHDRFSLKLVLVGDGDETYRKYLEELAAELNIAENVIFTGETANPELYYSEVFDINVLSSRVEALGRTLIEAAACGLPNVASNSDGMPEVVEDGVTGFLFEKENVDDLKEKLTILIRNRTLRNSLGEKGRERVASLFSVKSYVDKVQNEIFKQCRR